MLSALIHKKKSDQVVIKSIKTIPSVAKVANVTVANQVDVKIERLSVVCYTPSGSPVTVQARDDEHADWLMKMNPASMKILPVEVQEIDDRRQCSECINLSQGGRCLAAWRNEITADSRYRPVDNCPRRCYGFLPQTHDLDQRTGAERWPNLKEVN